MRPAFDHANGIGREAERRVADVFLAAGWFVQWKFMGHRHDLAVIAPDLTVDVIEVKNEDNKADTGNACIEVTQNGGVVSGLFKSESTVCVHTFNDDCLVYRTQPMRMWVGEKIRRREYPMRDFGDNGNRGVLVPRVVAAMQPFAHATTIAALPCSKVFRRP